MTLLRLSRDASRCFLMHNPDTRKAKSLGCRISIEAAGAWTCPTCGDTSRVASRVVQSGGHQENSAGVSADAQCAIFTPNCRLYRTFGACHLMGPRRIQPQWLKDPHFDTACRPAYCRSTVIRIDSVVSVSVPYVPFRLYA